MSTKTVTIEVTSKLEWRAVRSATSSRWIGICDAMNLSIEADSLDELASVIDETLNLVLIDLLSDNMLDQYLRKHGWSARHVPANANEDVRFDLPWHLAAEFGSDSTRRAC